MGTRAAKRARNTAKAKAVGQAKIAASRSKTAATKKMDGRKAKRSVAKKSNSKRAAGGSRSLLARLLPF